MNTLQEQIAACFPDTYTADTWKDLLPKFIAYQLDLYEKQVDIYEKELALWGIGDRLTAAPTYPILPVVFAEACEQQAQLEGFDLRALACCLYINKQRYESLQAKYQQVYGLCGEFSETSMELRDAYLALKDSVKPGKWLN